METELTEIECGKWLVIPKETHMIIAVTNYEDVVEGLAGKKLFSDKQIEAFDKAGIYDIPIIYVDDPSNVKLFQFECPVCRMFLDATHKEETVAEACRPKPKVHR